jgi:hypothetical protein
MLKKTNHRLYFYIFQNKILCFLLLLIDKWTNVLIYQNHLNILLTFCSIYLRLPNGPLYRISNLLIYFQKIFVLLLWFFLFALRYGFFIILNCTFPNISNHFHLNFVHR